MKAEKRNDSRGQTMDERQQRIHARAMRAVTIWLLLCLGIATFCRLARGEGLDWEWFAIVMTMPIMRVAQNLCGDREQPQDFRKRPLPLGNTPKERRARRKSYLVEAFCFCLAPLVLGFGWLLIDSKGDLYQFVQGRFPRLDRLPLALVTSLLGGCHFLYTLSAHSLSVHGAVSDSALSADAGRAG